MAKKKYYQRPDGLYETSKTVNGKRVVFRGRTCAEVDRKILEFREVKSKGRKLPIIADEWYEKHCGDVRISTRNVYGYALERIKKHFVSYASAYKPADCHNYIRDFESQGYARSSVVIELTVLTQVFAYAVICGDIESNPAREVKLSNGLPKKERKALTEDQEQKVREYRGDGWFLGFFLLYTGMRKGEAMALEWKDIDTKNGVIHVNKKLNYNAGSRPVLEDFLKSKNGKRTVPILNPLADVLPKNRIGKVFPNADGEYMTRTDLRTAWGRYVDGCGLEGVTPHQFRHSMATICYEAGIDTKAAAAILGDTEAVVMSVYTELRESHHKEAADRLNAYFDMLENEKKHCVKTV